MNILRCLVVRKTARVVREPLAVNINHALHNIAEPLKFVCVCYLTENISRALGLASCGKGDVLLRDFIEYFVVENELHARRYKENGPELLINLQMTSLT